MDREGQGWQEEGYSFMWPIASIAPCAIRATALVIQPRKVVPQPHNHPLPCDLLVVIAVSPPSPSPSPWGADDMSFRAMDDFDMFMGIVNCQVAMQSLLGFVKEHDSLQFVLLVLQVER